MISPVSVEGNAVPHLEVIGLTKRFPGVLAVDGVDMAVRPGEARALAGQNGSGKSTLIKVIAGVWRSDAGSLRVVGELADFRSPSEAVAAGISTIHQEVNLIPMRSVAENLFLAREPTRGLFIRQRQIVRDSEELLARYGLESVDPNAEIGRLSIAVRQMVAIVRAVSVDARLVIMDEPTSSLETSEVDQLFGIIGQLLSEQRSVLFVSHRLEEFYEVCETATVLRDGRVAYDGVLDGLPREDLVTAMIGRRHSGSAGFSTGFRPVPVSDAPPLLDAYRVSSAEVDEASVKVGVGEIIGLAGLLGAGRTEFAEILVGVARRTGGDGSLGDGGRLPESPAEALARGIALVPEDRRGQGIFPGQSVRENIVAAVLPRLTSRGLVDSDAVDDVVRKFVEMLDIKLVSLDQPIDQLSGGNQQKVILGRCLSLMPGLLITDEPTRGIDVGAKFEIQSHLSDLAAGGMGILLISSELDEVLEGTHRTVVMHDRRTVGTLNGNDLSEERLVELMSHGTKGH